MPVKVAAAAAVREMYLVQWPHEGNPVWQTHAVLHSMFPSTSSYAHLQIAHTQQTEWKHRKLSKYLSIKTKCDTVPQLLQQFNGTQLKNQQFLLFADKGGNMF